jgi:hypothetical protein
MLCAGKRRQQENPEAANHIVNSRKGLVWLGLERASVLVCKKQTRAKTKAKAIAIAEWVMV